ncbi:amidase family protein [Sphingomonas sp. MMS24-JH45]
MTGEQAFRGYQELRMLARGVVRRFETIDVHLCPVMTAPPPRIGFTDPASMSPGEIGKRQTALFPFAALFNFTGQPSLSLPLGMSAGGLPIGDDVHRALRRRGHAVPTGGAAGKGDAMGGTAAAGVGIYAAAERVGQRRRDPRDDRARPRDGSRRGAGDRWAGANCRFMGDEHGAILSLDLPVTACGERGEDARRQRAGTTSRKVASAPRPA